MRSFQERELVILSVELFETASLQTKSNFMLHLAGARYFNAVFFAARESIQVMKKIIQDDIPIRKSPELLAYFTNLRG